MRYSDECKLRIEYYKKSKNALAPFNQRRFESDLQKIRDGKMSDFKLEDDHVNRIMKWLVE